MRHFTPERFVRMQHVDALSFAGAFEEWERALQEYRDELSRLAPRLTDNLRDLAASDCLHDAVLLASWRAGDRLNLLLRPTLAGPLILLGYWLMETPWVDRAALPASFQTPHAAWLYDEISIEADDTFIHDVLLSNGWEIRLRFSALEYTRPEAGLPLALAGP